ncbi:hypothetical protein ANN_05921 [Periplaneta americana]|uniref:Uncharacterized protein n=1 Tax=Periplaneta americana TaxID=6978 RepID=A0ABQ8TC45_PERAM|nr:hypothetical protein ANN_05921 [Periplaneta americana]
MIVSRDWNVVRDGTMKVGDLSFEEVEEFKYLGATPRSDVDLDVNNGHNSWRMDTTHTFCQDTRDVQYENNVSVERIVPDDCEKDDTCTPYTL